MSLSLRSKNAKKKLFSHTIDVKKENQGNEENHIEISFYFTKLGL